MREKKWNKEEGCKTEKQEERKTAQGIKTTKGRKIKERECKKEKKDRNRKKKDRDREWNKAKQQN